MPEITVPPDWRDRLDRFAGRRRDLLVPAGIVGAFVVLGLVLWTARAPAQIAPPSSSGLLPSPVGTAVLTSVATPASVLVHVAGAVRRPGVYSMPTQARVIDAIEAAGGARPGAQLDALNLAGTLTDGLKIEVPGSGSGSVALPVASASAVPTMIDLNAADQPMLESVPGLGPVRAAAILQFRSETGGFSSVEQLLDVSGIGPATLEAIRPYVRV